MSNPAKVSRGPYSRPRIRKLLSRLLDPTSDSTSLATEFQIPEATVDEYRTRLQAAIALTLRRDLLIPVETLTDVISERIEYKLMLAISRTLLRSVCHNNKFNLLKSFDHNISLIQFYIQNDYNIRIKEQLIQDEINQFELDQDHLKFKIVKSTKPPIHKISLKRGRKPEMDEKELHDFINNAYQNSIKSYRKIIELLKDNHKTASVLRVRTILNIIKKGENGKKRSHKTKVTK